MDSDVIVVGAGLAGLVARRELEERGLRVLTLESGSRVGGRTHTVSFAGLDDVDLGAEWVSVTHHLAVQMELERYGLGLVAATGGKEALWLTRSGLARDADLQDTIGAELDWVAAQFEQDAARIDFDRGTAQDGIADLDVPFAEYLNRFELTPEAREVVISQCFSLMGAAASRHSALAILRELAGYDASYSAAFDGDVRRVRGGADGIARALASEGDGAILLEHAVTAVTTDEDSVTVQTVCGVFQARAVVIAVPLNVLPDIRFSPVPEELRAMLQTGPHAGTAGKVWLVTDGTDVSDAYSSGGPIFESYSRPLTGTSNLTAVFVDVSQPFEAAVELKKFVPGAVISAELTHNWLTDERARGSWLAFTPSQLAAIRTLHHLDGPVQFTGGDLADGWAGWMEGAVTAGAHTADIISQRWVAGTL